MMKEVSLQECLIDVIDNRGVTPHKRGTEWKDFGIPVYSANNIKTSGIQRKEEIRYIDEKIYDSWMKIPLEKGDILLTSEAPAGEVFYWDSNDKIIVGQRLYGLKVKKEINSKYLKYYLQSSIGQKAILSQQSGSTVSGISAKTFTNIKIHLPEKNKQDDIGEFLYILDKKNETNNKINLELESMVKTIYDYWFLQFEFPNEDGKPYKSSGGKMVWSKELKREIPEGWEVKKLKDIVYLGNDKKYEGPNVNTIDLSVMPSSSISLNEINESKNFDTNLYEMKKYDILFGSIRAYLKKAGIAPCDGAVTGTVYSFRCFNKNDYNFALETLCSDNMFNYACKNSKGSKMPVIGSDRILEYPIAYNNNITKRFNDISVKEMIASNVMENQELASLRDFLLPLLMNGQVVIED